MPEKTPVIGYLHGFVGKDVSFGTRRNEESRVG